MIKSERMVRIDEGCLKGLASTEVILIRGGITPYYIADKNKYAI